MVSLIIGKPILLFQPTHTPCTIIRAPIALFHCTRMLYITTGNPTVLLHHTHILYIIIGKPVVFLPTVSMLYDNIDYVTLMPSYVFSMSIKNAISLLLPTDKLHFSTLAIFLLKHLNRFSVIRQKKIHVTVYNFCQSHLLTN